MAAPRVILMDKPQVIRLAIRHIAADITFTNRWVSVTALDKGLSARYKFDSDIIISKKSISRSISKIEPSLDSLTVANSSGIYRGKHGNENYYFFQVPVSTPPYFPPTVHSCDFWPEIKAVDQQKLTEYLKRIERTVLSQRSKKKRVLDDVDIYLNNKKMATESASMSKSRTIDNRIEKYNYWNSPEAIKLFAPKKGDDVMLSLTNRINILTDASYNDSILTNILVDTTDINSVSSYQRQIIRQQCFYLRKAYEVAIQKMNTFTWTECVKIAIDELADSGITSITNYRTVQVLNIQFREKEKLMIPYLRSDREPKLFSIYPGAKTKFIRFCNQKVSEGILSTELAWAELKTTIATDCFNEYINEVESSSMISYDDFLKLVDLKTISYSTVWRWLTNFGFKYDKNSKSYYTDGHERKDVIEDRNERFLGSYYAYELRCHRWIQMTSTLAIDIEKKNKDFPLRCYHSYSLDGNEMREYHIDTHPLLRELIDPGMHQYGGNLSVCLEEGTRPIMFIGQDESTFHQFIFQINTGRGQRDNTLYNQRVRVRSLC